MTLQTSKLLQKNLPSQNNSWHWQYAQLTDIQDIYELAKTHFEKEMSDIFTISDECYLYAVDLAIAHQRHNLAHEQILVCRDKTTGKLLAYSWITRGSRTPYSNDEMAEARMLHIDLSLDSRTRLALVIQAISHWTVWCKACMIPILISTSIREDQLTFIKLHERLGFTVRGNICYLRIIPK